MTATTNAVKFHFLVENGHSAGYFYKGPNTMSAQFSCVLVSGPGKLIVSAEIRGHQVE